MRTSPLTRSAALLLLASAIPAAAQEKRSDTLLTVQHYLDLEQVAGPRISPDGKRVVYPRRYVNKREDRGDATLWIINVAGTHTRMRGRGGNGVWWRDGTRLAFLADGEPR